ncbi:MAG: flagellar biosynthesis protein FlhB [Planctomycetota bacterium]
MAEELFSGEKTEPASQRKRQEAREQGQVARSADLNTAAVLIAAFATLYVTADWLVRSIAGLMRGSLGQVAEWRMTTDSVQLVGIEQSLALLRMCGPLALAVGVAALIVNFVQVGFRITTQPLNPDPKRLDPIRGLQRIWSKRGVARLLFSLVKIAIVGTVLYLGCLRLLSSSHSDNVLQYFTNELPNSILMSNETMFRLGMEACIALLVLAILDFSYQRWQHEHDLMMTKQEAREELRRMEGDPKLKDRRRRLGQRLALQRMMQDVPKADVVITNPTHFACALRYESANMRAPRLVAKGAGHVAQRIRELAILHDVPVVEEPPLARLIYTSTEVGEEIAPELYQQVAEVLAYVYRISGGKRGVGARAAAGASRAGRI